MEGEPLKQDTLSTVVGMLRKKMCFLLSERKIDIFTGGSLPGFPTDPVGEKPFIRGKASGGAVGFRGRPAGEPRAVGDTR